MGKVRISAKHTAVARAVQGQYQSCPANAGASAGVHRDEESEKPMEAQRRGVTVDLDGITKG